MIVRDKDRDRNIDGDGERERERQREREIEREGEMKVQAMPRRMLSQQLGSTSGFAAVATSGRIMALRHNIVIERKTSERERERGRGRGRGGEAEEERQRRRGRGGEEEREAARRTRTLPERGLPSMAWHRGQEQGASPVEAFGGEPQAPRGREEEVQEPRTLQTYIYIYVKRE